MDFIARTLQAKIEERLAPGKAVLIYGARRVGKTILLKEIFNKIEGKKITEVNFIWWRIGEMG